MTVHKLFLISVGFLFFLCDNIDARAAISPADKDSLNFTQIMFEIEEHTGATSYLLKIAPKDKNFDNGLIFSKRLTSLACLVDGIFEFGNNYQWVYEAFGADNKVLYRSPVYRFHILRSKLADSNLTQNRIPVYTKEKAYQSLVIYDYGVIGTKEGRILWYLPQSDGSFRSMYLNNDGSITYNNGTGSYETDLKGKIRWKAPEKLNDSVMVHTFHHDFRKLSNGNFLCLAEKKKKEYDQNIYSVVFEATRNHEVKWYWDEEPFYRNRKDSVLSSHINSVMLDEARGVLYTSSRNINTLTKVNINSGQIIYTIGSCVNEKTPCYQQHFFAGQHALSILPDKELLFFNNNASNDRSKTATSSVMRIRQPRPGDTSVSLTWEYRFRFSDPEDNFSAKGGDADLLPNGNVMITMGSSNRTIEVTPDQEIVWESRAFRRDSSVHQWTPQSSFKTHYLSSLYPSYFTVQKLTPFDLKPGDTTSLRFKINNDGTEDDTYSVEVFNETGKALMPSRTITVTAGAETILTVEPSRKTKKNSVVKVRISSVGSPWKEKIITYKATPH